MDAERKAIVEEELSKAMASLVTAEKVVRQVQGDSYLAMRLVSAQAVIDQLQKALA